MQTILKVCLAFTFFCLAIVSVNGGSHADQSPISSGSIEFQGCYARWESNQLVAGNAFFERVWKLNSGTLSASAYREKPSGEEWLSVRNNDTKPDGKNFLQVVYRTGAQSPVEAESLVLEVTASDKPDFQETIQLFPNAPGVIIQAKSNLPAGKGVTTGHASAGVSTGVEEDSATESFGDKSDALESYSLAPRHLRLLQVSFMDQTDHHNELASEREWLLHPSEEAFIISGNLIFVENIVTGKGLGFLKLAPLPHARPIKSDSDFAIKAHSHEIQVAYSDYPVAIFNYSGGRVGRLTALQTIQRQLRMFDEKRDGIFLSNTWGDRSRDARINESFVRGEIAAGAKLGVDVVQIDDGWQTGRTKNSARKGGVWGSWWANTNFWSVNPERFPNGLHPVIADAKAHGMKVGLWFAPDSSDNAVNWQKDAARILELHRDFGINYFKIDSLKSMTPLACANQKKMFDRILDESKGQIVFDLDITAGMRPGYFGMVDIGPLFMENRYIDYRNYWPHATLRNLWTLAQYVDPNRLRVEFLNNTRKAEKYGDDPLAPSRYPADTLFAMTMMANPLGWFEASSLPKDFNEKVVPLVAKWKTERAKLHSNTTIPIGRLPDGIAWTGFASVTPTKNCGSILLFREMNQSMDFSFHLPDLYQGHVSATVLAGRGAAQINGDELTVKIPAQYDFVWIQLNGANVTNAVSSNVSADTTHPL